MRPLLWLLYIVIELPLWLVLRWQVTATHHASVRLGWKLLPKDRHGVDPSDHRSIRCPFGVQLHIWRATHA